MHIKNIHLIIVTDCGGSDEGRYRIAAERCFYPHFIKVTFFATESMNTLHAGFTAAAHAVSTIDLFGPLKRDEYTGILVNAAPRHGTENGRKLRGDGRKPEGEEIGVLRLRNRVVIIGPHAGDNFLFLKDEIVESYVLTDRSKRYTPFRSMEIMVPAFAKVFGVKAFPHLALEPKKLQVADGEKGVFVADWDSHGNIYLVSTIPDAEWVPPQNGSRAYRIGTKIVRLRHVNGIFAGNTGEQTLTLGSLQLNGKPVYYIVVVGGNAHSLCSNPPVGTRVEVENE